ncbi:MAG: hypothetical protein N3A61_08270, partial [Ignavibacteria bacterium]|nr:hypothetical protein [Ignavibacteria bacterium]
SAPYELAIKYFKDKFKPGDRIIYYITGNEPNVKIHEACELIEAYNPNLPNENVAYYLKKLEEYVERFKDFFSSNDFKNLFPTEDRLQFAFEKITVQNKKIEEE